MKIPAKKKFGLPRRAGYEYHVDRDGVSQGALATYLECRERARLSQILGWTSAAPSMPLILGSIGHEFLDWWHKEGTLERDEQECAVTRAVQTVLKELSPKQMTTGFKDELDEDLAIIRELLFAYARRHAKVDRAVDWICSEDEFLFRVDGTPVRGKIDGGFRSGKGKTARMLESKFKARWSEEAMTDWLPLDIQTGMYITAMKHDHELRDRLKLRKGEVVRSFRYDVTRKPQLRRRKEERTVEFTQRVAEDLRVRPEHYFHRWDVELTDADLQRHEERVFKLVREYRAWAYNHQAALAAGTARPDPVWTSAACEGRFSTCPYLPACARMDFNGLRQRERPYPELSDIRAKG